jgi:hypothetical protein
VRRDRTMTPHATNAVPKTTRLVSARGAAADVMAADATAVDATARTFAATTVTRSATWPVIALPSSAAHVGLILPSATVLLAAAVR